MGTNYYAVRNRPTTREPIHIGKASFVDYDVENIDGYRFSRGDFS